jgi:beta-aspartyl-peptidase (threonine type)
VLVIHGGAGTITRAEMTPERESAYRTALEEALRLGFGVLQKGGSSLDAVEATIRLMEDDPLFNAGKGAVFTAAGRNELDASIMDGATRRAGAVAGVTRIRHPISAARAVMERTEHVFLVGEGAEELAREVGLEMVDPSYFRTERRWQELQERRRKEKEEEEKRKEGSDRRPESEPEVGTSPPPPAQLGTVGAVALDLDGRLAAGTSTGGMTYKRYGRVGDSPVIGAGTYADPGCAVSATGHGEYFIRYAVAHDICARAAYVGVTPAEAARTVVQEVLKRAGGEGGVIVLDGEGRRSAPFNTEGMYRGWVGPDGVPHVAIHGDEATGR